mmetsp:Transcript_5173/g.12493  ORF Transcript_5173/g.12493 Transcript_5173/m.12493 type:complete len:420 (-) Transcript_5173:212-1471(-)
MSFYEIPAVEALPFYHDGLLFQDPVGGGTDDVYHKVSDHQGSSGIEKKEAKPPLETVDVPLFEVGDCDEGTTESPKTGDAGSLSSLSDLSRVLREEENPNNAQTAIDKYDCNRECVYSSRTVPVESLPNLPKPREDLKRQETQRGLCVVITSAVVVPLLTHYLALTLILPPSDNDGGGDDDDVAAFADNDNPHRIGRIVFLALIYTEAFLALVCVVGLLVADPCVIHRSPETCYPIPLDVESWVLGGKDSPRPSGLNHYIRSATGTTENNVSVVDHGTYCTRCLVWRKGREVNYYHCATCQRCCAYHDHHCGVFGRCIAGNFRFWKRGGKSNTNTAGNILYFSGLLVMGGWSYFTSFSAFAYAFSMRYGSKYALPISLLIIMLISCCCFENQPLAAVLWPFWRLMKIAKNLLRRWYRCC